jgi:hypothetical protein
VEHRDSKVSKPLKHKPQLRRNFRAKYRENLFHALLGGKPQSAFSQAPLLAAIVGGTRSRIVPEQINLNMIQKTLAILV